MTNCPCGGTGRGTRWNAAPTGEKDPETGKRIWARWREERPCKICFPDDDTPWRRVKDKEAEGDANLD